MAKILVLIPTSSAMNPILQERMAALAGRLPMANPGHELTTIIDYRKEGKHLGDSRAWSKVARVRNKLLDTVHWQEYDYVLWIDADVVDYPADMPSRLIEVNPTGITAPLVLVEGTDKFYDWAAFVELGQSGVIVQQDPVMISGRNLVHEPPYWRIEPQQLVVAVDCVGTIYVCPTDVYRAGYRHFDHPVFTDHFPICEGARKMGRAIGVHRGVKAYHADLPKYGEKWH
jgi:hypothetical protein